MHELRYRLDIHDGSEQIRRMRTRHQAGLLRQQWLQVVGIADGVDRVAGGPELHLQTQALGDADPGRRVGLVVELGHDDLVAGLELECRREVVEELGG